MAVDYEEGRRLLAAHRTADARLRRWPSTVDVADEMRASTALSNWLFTHAEALLNPDPWRPIEEAPKDGTAILAVVDGEFEPGVPFDPDVVHWHPDYGWVNLNWGSEFSCEYQPTHWKPVPHFRELKGPGQ